jgi:hypothetical protein
MVAQHAVEGGRGELAGGVGVRLSDAFLLHDDRLDQ